MKTFGVKALQTNPSLLTKAFESGEYSLITKHGSPIGVAVGFDTMLIDEGLKHFLALKAFSNGDMSLGELAACFGQTRAEVMKTLGRLHIPIADYRIEEELDSIATLAL